MMRRFQGACDASAAVLIAGTTFFVAASDEDSTLRVYDSASPGPAASELDVAPFLEPVVADKEPDIEGAAQIQNRIYWIGSHGRDKDGVEQESRHRLFATEVSVASGRPRLQPAGKPYKNLLADLTAATDLKDLRLEAAAALAPEAPGGLNIEGLTTTADGDLLVGFRNPIPQGRALMIRIENPAEVVAGTGPARVRREALLDLGNRGIRAIEPTLDGRYLILSGRHDDTRDFALYLWDGRSTAPTQLLDGTTLNDMNPEELLMLAAPGGTIELLSDDGDMMIGDKKCKKVPAANRVFRMVSVQLAL